VPVGYNEVNAENARTLCLEMEGRSLPVQVVRESRVVSAHTGRSLQELHGRLVTADAELHRWLSGSLRGLAERAVRSSDPAGDFAGKWIVSWNSYAATEEGHAYTVILREVEELELQALLLEGVELHPYEFRESFIGEGLALRAKLVGTHEDLERVRELVRTHEVLRVVRLGIQDAPREMRLGVAEWSPFEEGIKYRLVLVDHETSEEMRAVLARIEEENARAALGYYENFVERLVDLLVQRQVVTPEEVAALREAARVNPGTPRPDCWRVADVDALS